MLGMFGWIELIVIGGAMLLLFGGSRIPGVSAGFVKAVKYFKFALRGDDDIVVRKTTPGQKTDDREDP